MHRILSLLFFLVLATTIPLADALAQSSAGRYSYGVGRLVRRDRSVKT